MSSDIVMVTKDGHELFANIEDGQQPFFVSDDHDAVIAALEKDAADGNWVAYNWLQMVRMFGFKTFEA